MEAVNKNEMKMILGGMMAISCDDVVAEANGHSAGDGFDWDAWSKKFDKYCA